MLLQSLREQRWQQSSTIRSSTSQAPCNTTNLHPSNQHWIRKAPFTSPGSSFPSRPTHNRSTTHFSVQFELLLHLHNFVRGGRDSVRKREAICCAIVSDESSGPPYHSIPYE